MKHLAILAAVVFAVAAQRGWAQGGMGMDMKDKDRQGMDMSQCKSMMDKGGMGSKGMEMPKECQDMMDKQEMGADKKGGAKKGAEKKNSDKKTGSKAQAKVHKGSGIPTKIDAAAGKVTIDHGAVPTLNWPAMTMTFTVKDKAALAHVHEGTQVEFEFVQQGSDYVITKIH